MDKNNMQTIDGKPLDQENIHELTKTFERDWTPSESTVHLTERGKIMQLLSEINVPLYEAEALEKRAKQNKQSLSAYINSIIRNDLLVASD
ncbi:MAG: hypothetical protein FWC16_10190 [Defluviitaleaceae bacterium]|nr:hypothetical protein [Defluviitaleaceae bacterium]MCL2275285.1 hypothetical protein [Defluviitaleaceae bacterium]